ncbi:MAG: CocE/NonD family hydrolase [Actinomycetota bacterium]
MRAKVLAAVVVLALSTLSLQAVAAYSGGGEQAASSRLTAAGKVNPAANASVGKADAVSGLGGVGSQAGAAAAPAAADVSAEAPPPQLSYATMADGVKIALAVSYPAGFDPGATKVKWPTLFMMDGYDGGGGPINPAKYGNNYVTVHASVRGTGCSGGRFDLFDRRHAMDGYEIIENWIVKQPWSNGKTGIIGHSYPGLTGFLVASTTPPHLTAMAVSGLVDDLYRGIIYIGGIPNYGFALGWPAVLRPASELVGNYSRYWSETSSQDPTCMTNVATRPAPDVPDSWIVQGPTSPTDDDWFRGRSLMTWVAGIRAPIHITQQYQDEQTGPSGAHLWEHISPDIPKRLVLTNGVHSTTAIANADKLAWLDCWILHGGKGKACKQIADPKKRVQVHFETTDAGINAPLVSSDFPLPKAVWTRYYFQPDGTVSKALPPAGGAGSTYVALPEGRQIYGSDADMAVGSVTSSGLPDEVSYTLDLGKETAIAGPIKVNLWATSVGLRATSVTDAVLGAPLSPLDTDFFVQLIDVDPAGNYSYLQRGLLRASHRAVDELRSDRIESGPFKGEIYRPFRPHTNPTLVTPNEPVEYQIEVFPVGHVFRKGHKLLVKVHAPSLVDSLYAYLSGGVAVNTILQDAAHPSSILLPVLPVLPPLSATPPACGAQIGVRCVKPFLQ